MSFATPNMSKDADEDTRPFSNVDEVKLGPAFGALRASNAHLYAPTSVNPYSTSLEASQPTVKTNFDAGSTHLEMDMTPAEQQFEDHTELNIAQNLAKRYVNNLQNFNAKLSMNDATVPVSTSGMHVGLESHAGHITNLQENLSAHATNMKNLHSNAQQMHTGLTNHKEHLENMHFGLSNHKEHLENMHFGLSDHKEHLENMHFGLKDHQKHLRSFKTDMQAVKNDMKKMKAMDTGLRDHQNHLQAMRTGLLDQKAAIEAMYTDVSKKQSTMHTGLELHAKALNSTTQRLQQLEDKLNKLSVGRRG